MKSANAPLYAKNSVLIALVVIGEEYNDEVPLFLLTLFSNSKSRNSGLNVNVRMQLIYSLKNAKCLKSCD